MKKLMIALVSVLLMTTNVFAQKQQRLSIEEKAKKQTERMAEKLSLIDEQKLKVEAINLKYAQKQNEMMKSAKEEREAKMKMMKANREEKDAELKKVLTPEQYTLYQQNQQRPEKTKDFDKRHKKGGEHRNKKAADADRY